MEGHSILVVDDDPYLLSLIAEVLEIGGYAVRVASNGAEAVRLTNVASPNLVLLDVHMPILDGWGYIQAVRPREQGLPIVIMTGSHEAPKWAAALGADDYIGKPFQVDDLLLKVARYCS